MKDLDEKLTKIKGPDGLIKLINEICKQNQTFKRVGEGDVNIQKEIKKVASFVANSKKDYLADILKAKSKDLKSEYKADFLNEYLESTKKSLTINNDTALELLSSSSGNEFVKIIENPQVRVSNIKQRLETTKDKRALIFDELITKESLSDDQKLQAYSNYLRGITDNNTQTSGKVTIDLDFLIKYTKELDKDDEGREKKLKMAADIIKNRNVQIETNEKGKYTPTGQATLIKKLLASENYELINGLEKFITTNDINSFMSQLGTTLNINNSLEPDETHLKNMQIFSNGLQLLEYEKRKETEQKLNPTNKILLYKHELDQELSKPTPDKQKISERYLDMVELQESQNPKKSWQKVGSEPTLSGEIDKYRDTLSKDKNLNYDIKPGGDFDKFLNNPKNIKTLARLLEKSDAGKKLGQSDQFAKHIKENCHPLVQEKLLKVFEQMDERTKTRNGFAGSAWLKINDAFNAIGNAIFNDNLSRKDPGITEFQQQVISKENFLHNPKGTKKVTRDTHHYRNMIRGKQNEQKGRSRN